MRTLAGTCSGLSGCGHGMPAGLVLAGLVLVVVLWLVLARLAAGANSDTAVEGRLLDATDLAFTETAAEHTANRPYAGSRLLIQEVMDAAEPIVDPQGALHTLRWDVPGTFNGCPGTWELVINTAEKVIYRFDIVR
jgi:hypothetical protein